MDTSFQEPDPACRDMILQNKEREDALRARWKDLSMKKGLI